MPDTASDTILAGFLAQNGLYEAEQVEQAAEVLRKVADAGIETIRVVFPDQHGILRGKTLVAHALASAFVSGVGVPSTLLLKDTSHRTVFPVWQDDVLISDLSLAGANDVLLVPDPASLQILPWSPHSAMILCDVAHRSGAKIAFASRHVLRTATDKLNAQGLRGVFGLEVEFQIFERIDPALTHDAATMPPAPIRTRNTTSGYQYLTETRYGEVEDLLDLLRRHAQAMGLAPRSMEIEMGPSQFEFTFDPSDALAQADRYTLFRAMVKETCHSLGLHASFMAKPKLPNAAANGWHIHQSLLDADSGQNLFMPVGDATLTPHASGWIAGLLEHAHASCLLTTPTLNGYKRYAPFQLAPNRVQWGSDNRGAMVRALLYSDDAASRVENRVADSAANPYFALAAQILSGLDGLTRGLKAPAPSSNPYDADAPLLPETLAEAIDAFEAASLYRDTLGPEFVRYLAHIKRAEWTRYLATISEWEQAEYFNLF